MVYTNAMFGLRILLILVAIGLVVMLLKRLAVGTGSSGQRKQGKVDRMVQCHQCGVYLPEADAIKDGGHYYCSPQHRQDDQDRA